MNQYLITRMHGHIFSFLMQDQRALEIHCDPENADGIFGNIYICKIKNIAKNIGAAFVEIAPGLTCYLALEDLKNPIYTKKGASKLPQAGDELVVQVQREAIKTKYPSVTTNLTLQGKYVVLTTGNTHISVSSRLPKERREELLRLAADSRYGLKFSVQRAEADYGWIFRTNAGNAPWETILAEMNLFMQRYETLMEQAQFRTCYSCLLETPAPYLKRLANLYETDAQRILTDDGLYCRISDYLSLCHPEDLPKLVRYSDALQPMAKLYSLETNLKRALQERVWLKNGGYLVIQPTEALTAIDVNSGKYEGGKNREAAFLKLNLEAAEEIARQLRLRNISGIILVDFINMEEEASRNALLGALREALRADPVPAALVDMTKLFLVEITRMKREKSLAECCRELHSAGERTSDF